MTDDKKWEKAVQRATQKTILELREKFIDGEITIEAYLEGVDMVKELEQRALRDQGDPGHDR